MSIDYFGHNNFGVARFRDMTDESKSLTKGEQRVERLGRYFTATRERKLLPMIYCSNYRQRWPMRKGITAVHD